jgi:ABC-type phosphate/phosphonate transport system permease subunit
MKGDRGLVKMIIVVVIVLIILAYFGLNLRTITSSPTFIDNWNFIKNLVVSVWNNYLSAPVTYLWVHVFIPLIWHPAIDHITHSSSTPI